MSDRKSIDISTTTLIRRNIFYLFSLKVYRLTFPIPPHDLIMRIESLFLIPPPHSIQHLQSLYLPFWLFPFYLSIHIRLSHQKKWWKCYFSHAINTSLLMFKSEFSSQMPGGREVDDSIVKRSREMLSLSNFIKCYIFSLYVGFVRWTKTNGGGRRDCNRLWANWHFFWLWLWLFLHIVLFVFSLIGVEDDVVRLICWLVDCKIYGKMMMELKCGCSLRTRDINNMLSWRKWRLLKFGIERLHWVHETL